VRAVPTRLDGLVVVEPAVHGDTRGFFVETFRANVMESLGIAEDWVQDNHSRSARGVLRGMHFQTTPGQAKLIRCARGAVLDVSVDVRRGSPTFGEWESVALDEESGRMVYVPVGFAHGFVVTSEVADVVYKCSSYYEAATEAGFRFDDPDVAIAWPTDIEPQTSLRDAEAPRLRDIAHQLPFEYAPGR